MTDPKNPIEEGRGPERYAMGADADGVVGPLTPEQYAARLAARNAEEEVDGVKRSADE